MGFGRVRREGRPGRPRWIRGYWNAQRIEWKRRHGWTERLGWVIGKRRKYHRDLRSSGRTLSGSDPPLQSRWPSTGVQRGGCGTPAVRFAAAAPELLVTNPLLP